MYTPPERLLKQNEKAFVYHSPKEGQSERYQLLRKLAGELAHQFLIQCPESREQSIALTKLEEAVMFANASIARNE